jgi:ABC-2 type transport system ATP-binding protein
MAGVTHADSGSVRVLGRDPATQASETRAKSAYLSQAVELDPEMSGIETLRLFAHLHGLVARDIPSRTGQLADTFGLRKHLDRLVGGYSGGLRHRLHVAIAFVHEPDVVLMDEPTAALDPAGRGDVWHVVQSLRQQGRTVVLITHDMAEAARYCDLIVLLHDGHIAGLAPPGTLVAEHATWMLEVQLGSAPANDTDQQARAYIPSVGAASLRGDRLTVRFRSDDANAALRIKTEVMQQLETAGATVLGFRLDPPDLSSAYLELTGAPVHDRNRRFGGVPKRSSALQPDAAGNG